MTTEIPQNDLFDKVLMTDPEMEKAVRALTRKVLSEARANISKEARAALPNDPRQAYKAVRHSVYKTIIGGNVNILQKRKAGQRGEAPASSRKRSDRTEKLMTYKGSDRGFILRFLNAGTDDRKATNMNDHTIRRNGNQGRPKFHNKSRGEEFKGGIGNRGHIAARNWFPGASQKQMEAAAEKLAKLIDAEISKRLK